MKKYKFLLTLVIITHVAILSLMKFFPYPEIFVYSFLTKSGLVPYKQIIDQHFPGVFFFPVNLATLGIDEVWEMRVLLYLLVVLSHVAISKICGVLVKKPGLRLVGNVLFLLWQPPLEGYVLWIDSFAQTALLWAFYFLVQGIGFNRSGYAKLGGLMMGLTLILKQTSLPLVGMLIVYLSIGIRSRKVLKEFLVGILLPVAFLLMWVVLLGIWRDFYYWSFIFNITTFARMGRKAPQIVELLKVLPVVLPWIFSILWRRHLKIDKFFYLLLIFFLGSLFFAFARFDYVHLQPALPFAVIGAVYTSSQNKIYPFFLGAFIVGSVFFCIYMIRQNLGREVYFFGEFERSLTAKANYYRDGGKVFSFGTTPHIYYLTNTLPPGNVFVFQFPWFMKVAEDKILLGLMIDPPKVVLRDKYATVSGINLIESMPRISSYVERYYKVVDRVDNVDIMVRNN
jgi:hypothetical protein